MSLFCVFLFKKRTEEDSGSYGILSWMISRFFDEFFIGCKILRHNPPLKFKICAASCMALNHRFWNEFFHLIFLI